VVVLAGVERGPLLADPLLLRLVARLTEDLARVPVLELATHVIAALDEQHAEACRREPVRERSAPRAAADDDHVVVVHAWLLQTRAIGETHAPVAPRSFGWVRTSANSRTPSAASALVSRF